MNPSETRRHAGVCLTLAALCLAVFGQVVRFEFLNFDDTGIYANPMVSGGLTGANIAWAFTSIDFPYWQPLSWLSHTAVVAVFGLHAGWHHAVNLLLHVANTLLVFVVFRRLTGAFWRSALLAALFAVHPLRIESVAWVIERKDLLSGFWFLAAIWAYLRYVERRPHATFLPVLASMAFGLMSKPMVVTLPLLLLLLDWWPLKRRAYAEKIPLLLLSAVSCVVSYAGTLRLRPINWGASLPLSERVANSLVSLVEYLRLTFWPRGLAILYPYPPSIPWWRGVAAALLLAAITAVALWLARRRPYLIVGWLWFVIGLVPVIGLVQVGRQSMADRFTYLPQIGLLLAVIWAGAEILAERKALAIALGAILVLAAATVSWRHTRVWRDNVSVYTGALAVTRENSVVHFLLAAALEDQGRFQEALPHYAEAVRIEPAHILAQRGYGLALERRGENAAAAAHLTEAVRYFPNYADARYHLGIALARMGRSGAAVAEWKRAIAIGLPAADAADAAQRIQTISMQSP